MWFQVFKLHCEEGWFNRRTHQLTKFQLRRQAGLEKVGSPGRSPGSPGSPGSLMIFSAISMTDLTGWWEWNLVNLCLPRGMEVGVCRKLSLLSWAVRFRFLTDSLRLRNTLCTFTTKNCPWSCCTLPSWSNECIQISSHPGVVLRWAEKDTAYWG